MKAANRAVVAAVTPPQLWTHVAKAGFVAISATVKGSSIACILRFHMASIVSANLWAILEAGLTPNVMMYSAAYMYIGLPSSDMIMPHFQISAGARRS